jgi:hypothetical protein
VRCAEDPADDHEEHDAAGPDQRAVGRHARQACNDEEKRQPDQAAAEYPPDLAGNILQDTAARHLGALPPLVTDLFKLGFLLIGIVARSQALNGILSRFTRYSIFIQARHCREAISGGHP